MHRAHTATRNSGNYRVGFYYRLLPSSIHSWIRVTRLHFLFLFSHFINLKTSAALRDAVRCFSPFFIYLSCMPIEKPFFLFALHPRLIILLLFCTLGFLNYCSLFRIWNYWDYVADYTCLGSFPFTGVCILVVVMSYVMLCFVYIEKLIFFWIVGLIISVLVIILYD